MAKTLLGDLRIDPFVDESSGVIAAQVMEVQSRQARREAGRRPFASEPVVVMERSSFGGADRSPSVRLWEVMYAVRSVTSQSGIAMVRLAIAVLSGTSSPSRSSWRSRAQTPGIGIDVFDREPGALGPAHASCRPYPEHQSMVAETLGQALKVVSVQLRTFHRVDMRPAAAV